MSSPLPLVVLKPRKARPFFAGHPWVFAGSIARVEPEPIAGAEVEVVSHEGQFIARGLYNPRSAIRVRLYRWDGGLLDAAFWRGRIDDAIRLREDVLKLDDPDGACRLIFSEGDGLSGLTVDRYGRSLVIQITSLALFERRADWLETLRERSGAEVVVFRADRSTAAQEGLEGVELPVIGPTPESPVTIVENGLKFEVSLTAGQKTGWFLDQRDNRKAAASYAAGRRVLDLYCYTGGFALQAAGPGRAAAVVAIDSSRRAVETGARNAALNDLENVRFETADAFETLADLAGRGESFGMVVVDPPKFAARADAVEDALKGYLRLNRAALSMLEPGGILVTCSCSGLIDRDQFAGVLARAAELAGRPVQILESRGQAADHPVAVSCPESAYLKCLICRAGRGVSDDR